MRVVIFHIDGREKALVLDVIEENGKLWPDWGRRDVPVPLKQDRARNVFVSP